MSRLRGTVELANDSKQTIVASEILIATKPFVPKGGNGILKSQIHIAAGETRLIFGPLDTSDNYEFKSSFSARDGCEVESAFFSDGTHWEMPSPL